MIGFVVATSLVATSNPASSTTTSTTAVEEVSTVTMVEKRVNTTQVAINDTIIVEVIVRNLRDTSVYNVTILEPAIDNPRLVVQNQPQQLTFRELLPKEERVVAYSFKSLKEGNFTLTETTLEYFVDPNYLEGNAATYISYSERVVIEVLADQSNASDYNQQYLLIIAGFAVLYSLILLARTVFVFVYKPKA